MNQNKDNHCCFTGHRPEKLNISEENIRKLLEKEIDLVINNKYDTFITGMAMGVDIWAAEIVLKKKVQYPYLHLICAIPHPGFERRRSLDDKETYKNILKDADIVKMVSDHYFSGCYQVCNRWMVDHSSYVIAVWNGKPSGTKNTICYAKRKGIKVKNIIKD